MAGYNPRVIDEQTDALFLEANGQLEMLGNLRYNVGARYFETDQSFGSSGLYQHRHTPIGAMRSYVDENANYDKVLPSFNIASELGHGLVLRIALRRP